MKLLESFYLNNDVVQIAKDLIGKVLYTNFDGNLTAGIISETEAYAGITDKASHAYNGRFTNRTEVMFRKGGTAYVYLCYGVHSLFNVVTNIEGIPHAVLIRAIIPTIGIERMLLRANKQKQSKSFGIGPGNVSKILGIHYSNTGTSLLGNSIWIEYNINDNNNYYKIVADKRIGVDYAEEDALLPYRFVLKN